MTSSRLAPEAFADLADIFDYSEMNWGFAAAEKYIARLWEAFAQIESSPRVGRPASARHPALRRFRCASHLIIYAEKPDGVEIVRVLHQRMDIDSNLD